MAKRKATAAPEEAGTEAANNAQQAEETATVSVPQETSAATEAQPHASVQAPAQGPGRSYTIDNRVGYRKEDSPDGRRRQIRFADRTGAEKKPDDELLETVREQKPVTSWMAREGAWQARKDADGLDAIDSADQRLAVIGRKRTGQPER